MYFRGALYELALGAKAFPNPVSIYQYLAGMMSIPHVSVQKAKEQLESRLLS